MLKKLLCLALALTLLLSACALAEDSESPFFDLKLVKGMDQSVQEWYATSIDRAMYTVLIFLDCYLGAEDRDAFDLEDLVTKSSYVGVDEDLLVCYCHTGGKDLVIVCDPTASFASSQFYEASSDAIVEQVMEAICAGEYHKNNTSDIISALDIVDSIISSD